VSPSSGPAPWLRRIGVEVPVVQAGMGGGLAGHGLAAAVSAAGGLGTIGFSAAAREFAAEIAAARRLTDRPLAANILLPFAHRAHFEAASACDLVVTFWGEPKRRTAKVWLHQCGSLEEARAAHRAGANAVIAHGSEAGGHVRGTLPATDLLARLRHALPDGYPVLSAGGVADRADVTARLAAGAEAVLCGTRFVLSEECGAHPAYKARLIEANDTIVTELFGAGWPAPHRVVPNAATARWLGDGQRAPAWLRAAHVATAPVLARLPYRVQLRLAARQSPGRPPFGPIAATAGGTENLVDAGPLYAGRCVDRIHDVRPAGELVRHLAPR
jgi:NAD(P)H-dependent flavin oxidoreductase YrpB (nitropropane dioxygenase family)